MRLCVLIKAKRIYTNRRKDTFIAPSSCSRSLVVMMVDQEVLTLARWNMGFEFSVMSARWHNRIGVFRICVHCEIRRLRSAALYGEDVGLGVCWRPQPADAAVGRPTLRAPQRRLLAQALRALQDFPDRRRARCLGKRAAAFTLNRSLHTEFASGHLR